jgi:hypothetical protein
MLALADRGRRACPLKEAGLRAAGGQPARMVARWSRCDRSCMMTATLIQLGAVAQAVEETITTATPGFGHGHLADVAAGLTWLAGFVGLV